MRLQTLAATVSAAVVIGLGLSACSSEPFTNQREVSGVVAGMSYSKELLGPFFTSFRFQNETTEYVCSTTEVSVCNSIQIGKWFSAEVGSRSGEDNQIIRVTEIRDAQ